VSPGLALLSSRPALDFGPRPDPGSGVFETLLVTDGEVQLLDEQLVRLDASVRELYGIGSVPRADEVRDAAPPGDARLRVTFIPGSPATIDHGPIGPDPVYTGLTPFVLPGGLGPHKWADRRLLDAITLVADGTLPVLVDEDGSVLESARMNVLIEERGCLISPPADGRFRAGFGRRRLRFTEEPVDLDRLMAADAVLLTSALRTVRLSIR
jgi:para-aminobenzoate synthetase / 4-amino-4-deoxychorismate lyase